MSVEEELDALFGVKLDELLEVRKQHAAALRKAGDREGAARIAATPKPTPAAWAVNQLWRADRPDFDRLLEVGEALRDALRGSLAGTGDARAMQALQRQQRAAIEPLLASARARFVEVGAAATPAVMDRLTTTLQAISTTGAWGDAAPGRLTKELGTPDLATIAAMLGPAGAQASGPREMTPRTTQAAVPATPAATTDASDATSAATPTTAAAPARAQAAPASLDEARAKRRRADEERAKRLEAAELSLRDARAREEVATGDARVAQEALAAARSARRGIEERLAEAEAHADRRTRDAEEARRLAEEARRTAEEACRTAEEARASAGEIASRLDEGTRAEATDAERAERADAEAVEATRARVLAERAVSDARRAPR